MLHTDFIWLYYNNFRLNSYGTARIEAVKERLTITFMENIRSKISTFLRSDGSKENDDDRR